MAEKRICPLLTGGSCASEDPGSDKRVGPGCAGYVAEQCAIAHIGCLTCVLRSGDGSIEAGMNDVTMVVRDTRRER